MAVVKLERVCKRFDGARDLAVDDVSFTIADGEFMVLLGPSGCGKSTTLRMIAGLESITTGTLSIDGRIMNDVPARDRDIAMVFQSYALYPHMRVRDNLAFGLRRRGIDAVEIARRVESVAKTLGLDGLLDRKPYALSGGQRQRVALGRAIVRDPKVFLFDEPLSNLDAALRASTRSELIKQHQRIGVTMVYVTHDQVEAMTMGTRICIMRDGRVVQVGRPLDIYRNPVDTFVARFLGGPPMNLLPSTLVAAEGRIGARIGSAFVPLPSFAPDSVATHLERRVVFGIRPEDIYMQAKNGAAVQPDALLPAKVEAVEPLGAETMLILSLHDERRTEITARVGREVDVRPGDPVSVRLDVRATYLFDPESQQAIGMRREST